MAEKFNNKMKTEPILNETKLEDCEEDDFLPEETTK